MIKIGQINSLEVIKRLILAYFWMVTITALFCCLTNMYLKALNLAITSKYFCTLTQKPTCCDHWQANRSSRRVGLDENRRHQSNGCIQTGALKRKTFLSHLVSNELALLRVKTFWFMFTPIKRRDVLLVRRSSTSGLIKRQQTTK